MRRGKNSSQPANVPGGKAGGCAAAGCNPICRKRPTAFFDKLRSGVAALGRLVLPSIIKDIKKKGKGNLPSCRPGKRPPSPEKQFLFLHFHCQYGMLQEIGWEDFIFLPSWHK
jgi:hypothetical protein